MSDSPRFITAKKLYLEQLPDHLNRLDNLLQSNNETSIKEIFSIIHKLKGVSHLLGFTKIGDIAIEFSDYLTLNILDNQMSLTKIQREQISIYIQGLHFSYEELTND
jgi:chemotaxis protein histidine kinase CheA